MNFIFLFLMTSTAASPEATEALVSDERAQQDTAPAEEVGDCQDGVEDLKSSILGLEFYLRDKKNHKEFCLHIKWEQPKLETYKKNPKSYLPSGCVPEE